MIASPFFSSSGALNYGGMEDVGIYSLCLQALENQGNFYDLHKAVMDDGYLCPVVFRSYAVYAARGLVTDLQPARDNLFYYDLDRSLNDALEDVELEVELPPDTTAAEETIPEQTEAPEEG